MTEVAIYQPGEVATATPPPSGPLDGWIAVADQVVRLAQTICTSPFVPDGLRGSVPATAAAILAGRELGIPPMTALANVHVIKGKTGISALLMRALIQAQGHDWEDVEVTDTRAVVRGRRRGETEWTTASFTADQAKRAQIALGGYPQDKLYARATARLARRKFADVIAGMPYSAEELDDTPDGAVLAGESYHDEGNTSAAQPAKPRTAQRRQRTQTAGAGNRRGEARGEDRGLGADRVEPSGSQRTEPLHSEVPGPGLPPLPGEDEPDPTGGRQPDTAPEPSGSASGEVDKDAPGSVSKAQLTKLGAIFTEYHFTNKEREQRLTVASQIVGRELESSSDLSLNEARMLIDTLERCGNRDALMALLVAGDQVDDGEASDG